MKNCAGEVVSSLFRSMLVLVFGCWWVFLVPLGEALGVIPDHSPGVAAGPSGFQCTHRESSTGSAANPEANAESSANASHRIDEGERRAGPNSAQERSDDPPAPKGWAAPSRRCAK